MDGARRGDELPPALQPSALPPVETPAEPGTLAEPPADLSEPRQAFWRAYAPLAMAEGTLTAATAVGFRELSEQWALKESTARVLESPATDSRDKSEAMKVYVKL